MLHLPLLLAILLIMPAAPAVAAASTASEAERPTVLPGSRFEQGGLVRAQVASGSRVTVDGEQVRVDDQGRFVFGFHRDDPDEVRVRVRQPDGSEGEFRYPVTQREYQVQRIDGLPGGMVSPPEDVLARIRAEAQRVSKARDHDMPSAIAGGDFLWPTEGRISSVYGSQRILNGEPRQPHFGLDIAAPTGTPVRATESGVVRMADGDLYFTGGTIIIDHGHGVSSTYLHLSRLDVAEGDSVARGDTIGAVGATGRATGPHLCFRFNWFDKRLDPALLLPPRD